MLRKISPAGSCCSFEMSGTRTKKRGNQVTREALFFFLHRRLPLMQKHFHQFKSTNNVHTYRSFPVAQLKLAWSSSGSCDTEETSLLLWNEGFRFSFVAVWILFLLSCFYALIVTSQLSQALLLVCFLCDVSANKLSIRQDACCSCCAVYVKWRRASEKVFICKVLAQLVPYILGQSSQFATALHPLLYSAEIIAFCGFLLYNILCG